MRTRFVRVVVALSSLLGAVGAFAPQPASATSAGVIVFTGTAQVGNGLFVPCVTAKTVDPTSAPHTIWTPADKSKRTVSVPCNPRQSAWSFSSTVCTGVKANINKPGKDPLEGPSCFISAGGTLSGWCASTSGQGTGTATIGGHGIVFNIGWTTSAGPLLPFIGNVSKAGAMNGKVAGFVVVNPTAPPLPPPVPPVPCVNVPARTFTVEAGVAVFVDPTP